MDFLLMPTLNRTLGKFCGNMMVTLDVRPPFFVPMYTFLCMQREIEEIVQGNRERNTALHSQRKKEGGREREREESGIAW